MRGLQQSLKQKYNVTGIIRVGRKVIEREKLAKFQSPANSYSSADSVAERLCLHNAGFSGGEDDVCAECIAGKYKTAIGNMECTLCATGTYSTAIDAVSNAGP